MSTDSPGVPERLLTPSKITAWLDCAHYLTLTHDVEAGTRTAPPSRFGEMAQMLVDKGNEHEQRVLDEYRNAGYRVFEVPGRAKGEPFADWVDRIGNPLADGHDVVFQMPFVHDGIRGIADFLVRHDDPDGGTFVYEPVDAKLARSEAKPGHVLQLCFYTEAIEALTGRRPDRMHIALGSGVTETVRVDDVMAYWRRLRAQLARTQDVGPADATVAQPCAHCQFCEFAPVCEDEWRSVDSLVYVADIRAADRDVLEVGGVATMAELADAATPVADLEPERQQRLVRQAHLQVQARQQPAEPPPFELLPEPEPDAGDVTVAPVGFGAMPAPDDGDVFLDFEGHPFWRADAELFFLFGLIERSPAGEWDFRTFWAHDQTEEAAATEALVRYLTDRRAQFPGMHVYHYNHTERSALERLTSRHGVAEAALNELISAGAFIDLLPVVKGAMQVGIESYGLKHIELLTGYERGHDIDQGAGAVVEYERWTDDRDPQRLNRIAAYNEDDVRALRAVRNWLITQRPGGTRWRDAVLVAPESDAELDERIEALHRFEPGTPQHLLGDLLSYWRRERSVVSADAYRASTMDDADQLATASVVAQLTEVGDEPRFSAKTGKELTAPAKVFTFPPQLIDHDIDAGTEMIVALNEQQWAFFELDSIDTDAGELRIIWTQQCDDQGVVPQSLTRFPNYREASKLRALSALADELLDGRDTRVGHRILQCDPPALIAGAGPPDNHFTPDVDDICRWASKLDTSYLPVQGPPGTGKTFTGAHIVHRLVTANRRVGITAQSHRAIDNLLEAVVERFQEEGDLNTLRAVHKHHSGDVEHVAYIDSNDRCANGDFNVVAGTAWFFSSKPMNDAPVDVLVIDEAGQLGLADTLAATTTAHNAVLLGDPRQLPQVTKAAHPNGADASALEHLIGDSATIADDRGVLLDITRRMHPDVCDFISHVVYDGKLRAHPSCVQQMTSAGTGLRWIEADHAGNATESPEEAVIVADTIAGLIGTDWTDQHGDTRPLTVDDVIVVTPYNDQRRRIQHTLDADPITRGVEVGTVDKFQGREAAIVLFSMATSSPDLMQRTADFLFSKNRLNVAISRARCLAYLVSTADLLDTRARDVEEMVLISTLCAFVEHATALPDQQASLRHLATGQDVS